MLYPPLPVPVGSPPWIINPECNESYLLGCDGKWCCRIYLKRLERGSFEKI